MNQHSHSPSGAAYKNLDELPITFGPAELSAILGISRNKAYELANRIDFPKYRVGKKIIISKKHFLVWMDTQFGDPQMQLDK